MAGGREKSSTVQQWPEVITSLSCGIQTRQIGGSVEWWTFEFQIFML